MTFEKFIDVHYCRIPQTPKDILKTEITEREDDKDENFENKVVEIEQILRKNPISKSKIFPVASFLGCYYLPKGLKTPFPDVHLMRSYNMNIDMCLEHCTKKKFTFAALEVCYQKN